MRMCLVQYLGVLLFSNTSEKELQPVFFDHSSLVPVYCSWGRGVEVGVEGGVWLHITCKAEL